MSARVSSGTFERISAADRPCGIVSAAARRSDRNGTDLPGVPRHRVELTQLRGTQTVSGPPLRPVELEQQREQVRGVVARQCWKHLAFR